MMTALQSRDRKGAVRPTGLRREFRLTLRGVGRGPSQSRDRKGAVRLTGLRREFHPIVRSVRRGAPESMVTRADAFPCNRSLAVAALKVAALTVRARCAA
jgi:hypothetical protein